MPRVSILDKKIELNLEENEILYNGLEDQGIILPHGCLAGSCGACRVEVVEGQENLSPAGVIETNTLNALYAQYKTECGEEKMKGKTIRLSCRAKVIGDISIREITK